MSSFNVIAIKLEKSDQPAKKRMREASEVKVEEAEVQILIDNVAERVSSVVSSKIRALEAKNVELEAKNAELAAECERKLQAQALEKNRRSRAIKAECKVELDRVTAELRLKESELQQKEAELQAKDAELQTKDAELQTQLATARKRIHEQDAQLHAKDADIHEKEARLQCLNAQHAAEISALEKRLEGEFCEKQKGKVRELRSEYLKTVTEMRAFHDRALKEDASKAEALKAQLDQANGILKQKDVQIEEMRRKLVAGADAQELVKKLERAEAVKVGQKHQIADLQSKLAESQSKLAESQSKLDNPQHDNRCLQGRVKLMAEREGRYKARIAELEAEVVRKDTLVNVLQGPMSSLLQQHQAQLGGIMATAQSIASVLQGAMYRQPYPPVTYMMPPPPPYGRWDTAPSARIEPAGRE